MFESYLFTKLRIQILLLILTNFHSSQSTNIYKVVSLLSPLKEI